MNFPSLFRRGFANFRASDNLLLLQGSPADQDAWIPLPDGTAAVDVSGIQPYTDLLLRYLNDKN